MTDPNYTAMLLVIDRSGSMAGIRDDMVGGLTAMLAEQAAQPGMLTSGTSFLGANQDAVLTGTALGFEADSSMTYAAGPDKVGAMNSTLNHCVRDVRGKTKRGFTEAEREGAGDE